MTKKTNIKITNCETDTKSQLRSDHFPIIANLNIKFKTIKKKKEEEVIYITRKRNGRTRHS